jgi:pimeloyl-ACP methyl ester carboxylesterase
MLAMEHKYPGKGGLMRIVKIILAALAVIIIGVVGFVYLAPENAGGLLLKVQRAQAGLDRKEIQLADGLRYVYLEGGKGDPLMLLHGFGANKDNFAHVAGYLTTRYRVIIPDHIGFGESAHPVDADYSPSAQAKRLRAFAHALGITSLHIGGHSMGGHIAMTYAALYPEEVKSLWLLDPAGVWSAPKSVAQTNMDATGHNGLLIKKTDDLVKLFQFAMSSPPYIPRPILNVLARQRIKNYTLEQRIFNEIMTDSVEQRVTGLATPTLIVWGSEDRIINVEASKILNKLMPRSQVIVMQHVGHLPMLEAPKQSAQDYLKFRASLDR